MALTELDAFLVDHPGGGPRPLIFLWGDVTKMAPSDAVDVLVVSARPGAYTPTPGSVIGALAQNGISIASLAQNKAANYEPKIPCWISQPVHSSSPGIQFGRILVYEPANPATTAVASAWAIFQALACYFGNKPVRVAMPLVCTGCGGANPSQILQALSWAAAHWCSSNTTTITTVKIVAHTQQTGQNLKPTFAALKSSYQDVFSLNLKDKYKDYVTSAKKIIAGRSIPKTLTWRQAVAICIYTSGYYHAINPTIRDYKPTDPSYVQMYPLFEAIDSGLSNVAAYTATAIRGENLTTRRPQYYPGAVITNLAYTSASSDNPFKEADMLYIASKTGRFIKQYSQFQLEDEVLFGRGFTFQIATRNCNVPKQPGVCNYNVTERVTNWCGG
jgi:NAD:arginine ADP-ribosyltransferase